MNHEITITQFAREKCHPSFEAFDQKDMELFYRGPVASSIEFAIYKRHSSFVLMNF